MAEQKNSIFETIKVITAICTFCGFMFYAGKLDEKVSTLQSDMKEVKAEMRSCLPINKPTFPNPPSSTPIAETITAIMPINETENNEP